MGRDIRGELTWENSLSTWPFLYLLFFLPLLFHNELAFFSSLCLYRDQHIYVNHSTGTKKLEALNKKHGLRDPITRNFANNDQISFLLKKKVLTIAMLHKMALLIDI